MMPAFCNKAFLLNTLFYADICGDPGGSILPDENRRGVKCYIVNMQVSVRILDTQKFVFFKLMHAFMLNKEKLQKVASILFYKLSQCVYFTEIKLSNC